MTLKPKIYYDASCPICSSYVRVIQKKIPLDMVDYLDAGSDAKDFKYTDSNGSTYTGTMAIERMSKDFPAILDFMWVLPPSLRTKGLKAVYKASSVVRRTLPKIKKGCNCGH